ncbi:type VI secretion system protein TssA [Granulicella tundricola]|uniref:Type VI secretion-associated protein, ImpA family n=1 Tax=Granulicella tundricola (strain ATCC BAA-1859 / DSM 23138 / MP5ACTX9) TaxID=1198114 RepID=E8X5R3_GRATM|nr:type VI secretion system protein TssA [Granulicella tundricola]ADW70797.1 type VI secretion-associated protein, ImpA family [Granulicella tundricola MP5ACTX9]
MPLREDLLEPIAGANPSGTNLYYDKVFDQIKEARIEDDDSGSAGAWERTPKKADHVLVIKLASETLAKRTKDLRLAGWLIESHLKREGIALLPGCLDLILKLQDQFWDTVFPEIDDDGDLGLRVTAIEAPVNRIASFVKGLPILKNGFGQSKYVESRKVGYEKAADTKEKREARQDAINQGQVTAEDFDIAFAATPKTFFVATEEALTASLLLIDEMGVFQEDKYGDDYPAMNKLVTSLEEVKQAVSGLLNERRKTEPDIEIAPEPEPEPEPEPVVVVAAPIAVAVESQAAPAAVPVVQTAPLKAAGFGGVPTTPEQAHTAVMEGALFLHGQAPQSPVPYLVCSGLRFGEMRAQGAVYELNFAVAPPTETRQALKRLASESNWNDLLTLGLKTLGEPCARTWLDLQRYLWRGATGLGANALAAAIVSTVRGVLIDLPEIRGWSLDDDTPAANAETQQWIDAAILPPAPVIEEEKPTVEAPVVAAPPPMGAGPEQMKGPDIYEQATILLKSGKTGEAITLLVRDAELQPSGRTRFQRRVQVAQLCLVADQGAIAYPVLVELSKEIERRGLETWETGEMLAHPLGLLLKCLDKRGSPAEEKEVVFERLCRLDPQAALGRLA